MSSISTTNQSNQLSKKDLLEFNREMVVKGQKSSPSYLSGKAGGDKITGDGKAPFADECALLAFSWANMKEVNKETTKSALPQNLGACISIHINSDGVVPLHQAHFKGTTADLVVNLSEFDDTGKMTKVGSIQLNQCRIAAAIYEAYSDAGSVVHFIVMPESHEISIGKKAAKWNSRTNSDT